MIKAGELQIQDLAVLESTLKTLQASDWVVYIQPPPKDSGAIRRTC